MRERSLAPQVRIPLVLIAMGLWPIALRAVGVLGTSDSSASAPMRIVGIMAMLTAPALTYWLLGRLVPVPGYALEGALGWSALLLLLTFTTPSSPLRLVEFLSLLLSLTVALAVVGQLAAWVLGMRVYRGHRLRDDPVRIRRQGYVVALVVIVALMLRASGTLTPATFALLLLIAVLAEALVHRRQQPQVRAQRLDQEPAELHQAGDFDPARD